MLALAASDLQQALAEIARAYQSSSGQRVRVVFGSTGSLATQIENGAPADLFFAASEGFLDRLAAEDLLDPRSRRIYALGRLALLWDPATERPKGLEALADRRYRTISIANPEHAPYGMAAREALQSAGLWAEVEERLVFAENVAQAHQFVRTGNADAGIVALGLVAAFGAADHLPLPDSLHAPLRQGAAVLRRSRHTAAANRFLDFVMGAEGQRILRRHGFAAPP